MTTATALPLLTPTPEGAAPSYPPYLGRHILAEFYQCDANILNNPALIETMMGDAAEACGATIVQKNFHLFSPYGVSGVVIIAESHLAIHTWPELEYAAVDLFTCGDACDPMVAYQFIQQALNSGHSYYSELTRGMMNPGTQELVHGPFEVKTQLANRLIQEAAS